MTFVCFHKDRGPNTIGKLCAKYQLCAIRTAEQRIIQTESHERPSFLRKVHRLDPPVRMSVIASKREVSTHIGS